MAYLLDSSVFITAKRVHYGFDFCPAFWDWLREQHHAGKVYSIDRVYDELKDQQDDLADWVRRLPDSFFISPDAATVPHFSAVSNWTRNQNYHAPAITTFLQTADYYLVAQALQGGHRVVTTRCRVAHRNRLRSLTPAWESEWIVFCLTSCCAVSGRGSS
jgi:hypothetical protein